MIKMKPQRKPTSRKSRFPVQIILGILVVVAVAYAILITGPTDDTVMPVPPTATPIPTEFILQPVVTEAPVFVMSEQTTGVIIGAASVMLIIVAGTVIAIYPSLKKKS